MSEMRSCIAKAWSSARLNSERDVGGAHGEHVLEKGEACPLVEMLPTMAHVVHTILNDHALLQKKRIIFTVLAN